MTSSPRVSDLLDVTAIAPQAGAFLFNLRGLGKDAHACPLGTPDRIGRVSFFASLLMAKKFEPMRVSPSIPE